MKRALAARRACARLVKGISTRKVDGLVQARGMSGISRSQVSRLCADPDERVETFLQRPLAGQWAYVWLDATYLKSRERGPFSNQAVVVAVGVNSEGRRETLGMAVGPPDTEAFWTAFLRGLVRRGLSGVRPVISDAHEGLKQAIAKIMDTSRQRCRVAETGHRQMNILALRIARRVVCPAANSRRFLNSAHGGQ